MTDLSPAAQLVWDAFCEAPICAEVKLASALRAIAENCVPDDSEGHWVYIPHVLTIADELEAQKQKTTHLP
mgnify:CR=1 FL=1